MNAQLPRKFPASAVRAGTALMIAAALPVTTHAQVIDEVVVTAQKREQSAQEVGISITAMSGDQLRELGITNTAEIAQQVPGLQVFTFTPAFIAFNLRGISQNNFQDNLEAPVAVYVDEAYVASMNGIGGQLFDVSRVEVLRGPQGTLFGRNATGGLIHYITHGASDQELNGYVEASVSDYNKRSFEGAVGGAISDRFRARLAGRWEKADGYVKSTTPGVRDAHGADGYALRGSMQFDFTDKLKGDLRVAYSKDDDVPSGAYTVSPATFDPDTGFGISLGKPADPWKHNSNYQGRLDRDVKSATGKLTWTLNDAIDLTSISNYLTLDKFYTEDADGDVVNFPYTTTADFTQYSEELRLSGNADRLRWQVGAYYLDMSLDMGQTLEGEIILGGPTERVDTLATLDSRNWSIFGQVEYDLTEALTLIAGARWSQDNKNLDMNILFSDLPNGIPPTETFNLATDPAFAGLDEIDKGDYAARLQLDWRVSDQVLAYASFNRGIKGGNWSIAPNGGVDPASFRHGPETLNAYEVGVKTELAGGAARFNAGVFYYDYLDYQAFSLNNLIPQVSNSDAKAQGGELELQWLPSAAWYFSLGASFIDSTVDKVPTVFGGVVEAEFPNAPTWSLTYLGKYSLDLVGGRVSLQLDGVTNDDQFLEGTNSQVSFEKSYSVLNARIAYTNADANWEIAAWVKNLTNEEYRLYNLDLGLAGFIESVYAPPRWFGVTANYRW
jgi:iron complex outermembrane recepter protein